MRACVCEGMADYQHVVPVHADVARRKKRNWAEVEEPHFGEVYLYHFKHVRKLRGEKNTVYYFMSTFMHENIGP